MKKKNKFFFTPEEIEAELVRVQDLQKSGKLIDYEIPEYFCQGTSPYSKRIAFVLAVFLGFLGVDRFYLRKWISGFWKLFFVSIISPIFIWLIAGVKAYETYPDVIIVFGILFFAVALTFYITDILMNSVLKQRDGANKCLKW